MYRYVLKRLLLMIPVLLGVTLIVFSLMYIAPGDPVQMLLGDNATQEDIDALNAKLGRDDPFVVQYVRYAGGILTRFDFGESYFTGRPVMTEILERFPNTALLAVLGCALSIVIGVTCGVIAATRQYSIFDNLATATSLIGVSMPSFWFGLLLIIFFSIQLGWLPASGSYGPLYFVMPAITLGVNGAANIMRTTRSSMLETILQDYIRTARGKGQVERKVIINHALKNALIPVITVIGIQFGNLLGVTTVLCETVFAIPGIGKYLIDSIKTRDTPVVMGCVLFMAILFSFVNLGVDILYSYIDPRIKSQYQKLKKRKEVAAVEA